MRRQDARRAVSAYGALLATPATGGTITAPAGAGLYVRATANRAAGKVASVGGVDVGAPAMQTGDVRLLGYVQAGATVVQQAGIELLLDVGLGSYVKVSGAI